MRINLRYLIYESVKSDLYISLAPYNKEENRLIKKVIAAIVAAVFVIIAGGYLAGRYYFSIHFYPNTKVNNVEVSMKTGTEALSMVESQLNSYALGIKSGEGTETLSAVDCMLQYTDTTQIQKLVDAQNEDYWFMDIFTPHEYTAMGLQLDETKLKEAIDALACMNPANPQEPVDAQIEYNETQNAYVVVDEIIGNIIVPETFYEGVKQAILAGETILDLSTNEYYKQPTYTASSPEVTKAKATLDKYMSTVIHYEDLGKTYTLDSTDIHTFIKIGKKYKISLDKDLIKQYVSDKILPVFTTVGMKRTIKSPGSGTFTCSGGGYGWQVGLIDERAAIIENIKAGGEVTREPKYLQDAAVKSTENDIGDTYVDVSIDDQHLWVVKDGKVVMDSDFVSGNVSTKHGTTKGVFMVERKQMHYRMEDYNVTVTYWMPFNVDLGEGFHDASWRSKFGGSIYKTDGSHGCINLPPSFAKKLYNYITVRYPVIVH